MKYLVVFLVVLVALFWWKANRREERDEPAQVKPPAPPPPAPKQIEMVRCHVCGLHLPRDEAHAAPADAGPRYYCSVEHRRIGAG